MTDITYRVNPDVTDEQLREGITEALLAEKFKAQPEPEPVFAFRRKGLDDFCTCSEDRYNELAQKPSLFEVKKFYTAPPQREWQGLTDEEGYAIFEEARHGSDKPVGVLRGIRAIETKLKEKNCAT